MFSFNFEIFFKVFIIMNNMIVLFGLSVVSAICIFLLFQSYKQERFYTGEINRMNRNMIQLQDSIREKNNVIPLPPKEVIPKNVENYNNLKTEYDDYVNNFIPENIKTEIDTLTNEDQDNITKELEEAIQNENNVNEFQDLEVNDLNESQELEDVNELESQELEDANELESQELEDANELESQELEDANDLEDANELESQELVHANELEDTNELEEVNMLEETSNSQTLEVQETEGSQETNIIYNTGNNINELEKLTLKELQIYARQNNIKVKGKKSELITRIKDAQL